MAQTRKQALRKLGGAILASVSRSFCLSIKVLPAKLREPLGLAYLLARTADTIADTADVAAGLRLRHLQAFSTMINSGANLEKILVLQREITPPDPAERTLLEKMEQCLEWLDAQPEADRADIVSVLEKIIHGQSLDLLSFPGRESPQALRTATELDEYTYLVAGCVGEFWTRICCRHLKRCAQIEEEPLCALGVSFGKGLQLVNILRDMPADLRAGRCYLPADELKSAGVEPPAVMQSADAVRPVFETWLRKAIAHLDGGFQYIEALLHWRVRFACILPWAIALRTLALLSQKFPLTTSERVKISRPEVRSLMFQAILGASSNKLLHLMRSRLNRPLPRAMNQAPDFGKK
jgi:farnesyl-diphosphate farnesyltransferase